MITRKKFSNLALALVMLLSISMIVYNISGLEIGRDEGVHAFAAKNLAFTDRYTLTLVTDYHDFDWRIAVGPTIIAPTALVFKLFGISIFTIRVVPGIYFILFILCFYLLVRREFGTKVSFLTCLLILSAQWSFWRDTALFNPIYRTLTGESAGLFFLALSLLLWKRSGLSAFVLGLAVLTKYQFALAIVPFSLLQFGTVPLRDRPCLPACAGKRRQAGLSLRICRMLTLLLVMLAPLIFWFSFQLISLGPDSFWNQLSSYRNFSGQAFDLSFIRIKQNIIDKWLELNPIALKLFFTLPAIIYGWVYVIKNKFYKDEVKLFMILFPTVWMVWYIFSRGYIRYEIPGLYFSLIFLALFFFQNGFQNGYNPIRVRPELKVFIISMSVFIVSFGFYINFREAKVVEPKNSQNMAEYILANVSQDNILTGELDFAVDLFLHNRPPLFHAFAGARQKTSLDKNFVYPTSGNYTYIISKDNDPTFENLLKIDDWQFVKKFGDLSLYKFVDCGCGEHLND